MVAQRHPLALRSPAWLGTLSKTVEDDQVVLSISINGTPRRPVIVVGPIALKLARNAAGRTCNRYEADLYRITTPRRRAMLGPALHAKQVLWHRGSFGIWYRSKMDI